MKYEPKEEFMREAIRVAHLARGNGDYSIGSVIVYENRIISLGENRVKVDKDPTSHAEIVAIRRASKILENRHIEGAVLYTTHEPCPMCVSAAVWGKLSGIISGTYIDDMTKYHEDNSNNEWLWRTIKIDPQEIINKSTENIFLIRGFMRDECLKLFHNY
ncbi:nucleoside deaminase [Candidatus Woesearchaeota archaeon]|nr:nucleoside deaminase [Candidatus Woesearchaeota archaeon]